MSFLVKRSNKQSTRKYFLAFLCTTVFPCYGFADAVAPNALPQNPVTEAGSATYGYTSNTHDVNMGSSYVKTLYDSYNIGRDATVNINGSGTFVGRVKETGGVSHIYGNLNAPNANVFLLNQSGITFYGSSQVNVGSLVATTAENISHNDGKFEFTNFGDNSVINAGNISVSDGGFAVLVAPDVQNSGVIQANLGTIELASATEMTIDLRGDNLIKYAVTEETLQKAGVKNTGTLKAQSGTVNISANVVSDITKSVVNLDGVIDADSFADGKDGGTVLVSSTGDINMNNVTISANGGENGKGGVVDTWADGTNNFNEGAVIEARGGKTSGDGGFVEVSGNNISYAGHVDASAKNGKNGLLLIDPTDIAIKNGTGATDLNTMYERTIENLLQGGTNVSLQATNSITLENLADNELTGGSGSLTLDTTGADSFIRFLDKNDAISTTSGNITITSGRGGIDIGTIKTNGEVAGNFGNITIQTSDLGGTGNGNIKIAGIDLSEKITTNSTTAGRTSTIKLDAYGDVLVNGDISIKSLTEVPAGWSKRIVNVNLASGGNVEVKGSVDMDMSLDQTYAATWGLRRSTASFTINADKDIKIQDGISIYSAIDGAYGDVNEIQDASIIAQSGVLLKSGLSGTEGDINIGGDIKLVSEIVNSSYTRASSVNMAAVPTATSVLRIEARENLKIDGDIDVSAKTNLDPALGDGLATAIALADIKSGFDNAAGGDIDITGKISSKSTASGEGLTDMALSRTRLVANNGDIILNENEVDPSASASGVDTVSVQQRTSHTETAGTPAGLMVYRFVDSVISMSPTVTYNDANLATAADSYALSPYFTYSRTSPQKYSRAILQLNAGGNVRFETPSVTPTPTVTTPTPDKSYLNLSSNSGKNTNNFYFGNETIDEQLNRLSPAAGDKVGIPVSGAVCGVMNCTEDS